MEQVILRLLHQPVKEAVNDYYNEPKGFQDGSSKMARRKCYGYKVGSDGELTLNPEETKVVSWIFERYGGLGTLSER